MILRSSKQKTAIAYRTLRDAPLALEQNVDIVLFLNYYGQLNSFSFSDPTLITDKTRWSRFKDELKAMRMFKREKKACLK